MDREEHAGAEDRCGLVHESAKLADHEPSKNVFFLE
jgi:hypothetical protein